MKPATILELMQKGDQKPTYAATEMNVCSYTFTPSSKLFNTNIPEACLPDADNVDVAHMTMPALRVSMEERRPKLASTVRSLGTSRESVQSRGSTQTRSQLSTMILPR